MAAWIEEFDVRIPSSTTEGQKIQERIISQLEAIEFPTRGIFGIRLALEEALVNAIKHGNGMDPGKTIRIVCQISKDKIRVVIEDQGRGFRVQDVPDPTEDENLEKPCGRGIMLMRAFLTLVEYNERGNRVTLEKHRGDDAPPVLS
jgi:serine/threonine-protein kinase RsbW